MTKSLIQYLQWRLNKENTHFFQFYNKSVDNICHTKIGGIGAVYQSKICLIRLYLYENKGYFKASVLSYKRIS